MVGKGLEEFITGFGFIHRHPLFQHAGVTGIGIAEGDGRTGCPAQCRR